MKWGPWQLNTQHLSLVHENGYEVSLQSCTSSAEILDWIFQIHAKSWADVPTVRGLLAAFSDILEPQANFCSGGVERGGNGAKVTELYIANPKAREQLLGDK